MKIVLRICTGLLFIIALLVSYWNNLKCVFQSSKSGKSWIVFTWYPCLLKVGSSNLLIQWLCWKSLLFQNFNTFRSLSTAAHPKMAMGVVHACMHAYWSLQIKIISQTILFRWIDIACDQLEYCIMAIISIGRIVQFGFVQHENHFMLRWHVLYFAQVNMRKCVPKICLECILIGGKSLICKMLGASHV